MATFAVRGQTFLYDFDNYMPFGHARKPYQCSHAGLNCHPLDVPCAGGVEPGQPYMRARQSWLDWEPVNFECAIAAGLLRSTREPAGPAPDTEGI